MNALYLLPGRVGGTEIYLRSLLAALAAIDSEDRYVVYVNRETGDGLLPASPHFETVRCNVAATFRPLRLAYEQFVLPWRTAKDGIDVLFNPGFTAPVFTRVPSVTVFHDLQHKRHPEFFRPFERPFWNLFLWLAARRSRRLIAVSEATARDLAAYYPFARARISVVRHGVDAEFFRIGSRRDGRPRSGVLLAVSTTHPHKNFHRLLEGFGRFRQTHPEYRLVIAGLEGRSAAGLETARRRLGLEDAVSLTGWIPREELYRLFESADALIAPSLFEGFGMPVLEALAAGIPTAVAAIPVFDEVAGDAAVRFDPLSVDAIAGALTRLADDEGLRSAAQRMGPERARTFDWATTAAQTLNALKSVF